MDDNDDEQVDSVISYFHNVKTMNWAFYYWLHRIDKCLSKHEVHIETPFNSAEAAYSLHISQMGNNIPAITRFLIVISYSL